MRQVIQDLRSGRTVVEDVPAPVALPGGVLVRNRFSLISAGTERMVVEAGGKGLLNIARERPDLVRRTLDMARKQGIAATIEAVSARLDTPVALGYSCAGRVVELGEGVSEYCVGDLVACAGAQYANHAEFVFVPKNLCVRVPSGVSALSAAFVTLGAIAIQGVRVADVRFGESVAVIGLGLVGQLTVQVLRAAGCRVCGIDLDPTRVRLALELGAEAAVARNAPDLLDVCKDFTGGRGMDAVIVTADTTSNDPIELAGELARDRAVVSAVGAVGMQVPRGTYYAKELQLKLSRSYGPGRYDPRYEEQGIDYPIGYVRWTEQRNMQAFLDLVARGAVQPERLISHQYPVDQAQTAYALIAGKVHEPYLAVLLEYPQAEAPPVRSVSLGLRDRGVPTPTPNGRVSATLGVGFVGAGNFARSVLLPAFRASADARLVGVATANGVNAQRVARRYGFSTATTDYRELLASPDVGALVVATRHNLHAEIAVEALRLSKAVFLEKPMAMNVEELRRVLAAWREGSGTLLVGFNRRFAPLVQELRAFFGERRGPLALNYRVNVGPIPAGSWIHDPLQGGGAVLSEACHFVDLLHFLVGQPSARVYASYLGATEGRPPESVVVHMEFADGSVGSVTYSTAGDPSVPKERLEVIGDGAVAILDDFVRLDLAKGGRRRTLGGRFGKQDKGHRAEVQAFIHAALGRTSTALDPWDAALSTLATFRVLESLERRAPVALDPEEFGL